MLLIEALGSEVQRAYGRRPDLPSTVIFGPDAPERMAASLALEVDGRNAVVLFDERTRQVSPPCLHALREHGFCTTELLVPDRDGKSPVCDDRTHAWLSERITGTHPGAGLVAGSNAGPGPGPGAGSGERDGVDVLVAIGSGVINDLTKWLAAEMGIPYAVFATASSMNGYASANVAAKIEGVKTLVAGRAARVVAADPAVLASAPHRLTSAGFGDLLAKPVSTADWMLNHLIFDEPFSRALASVADRFAAPVLTHPEALAHREPEAVRALFEALVISGATMTLHGSSLPASGGEHLISHALDMMSDAQGDDHDLHGRQVGVATVVTAALWERMMQQQAPRFEAVAPPLEPARWGLAAQAVAQHHEKKKAAIRRARDRLSRTGLWDALRAGVADHLTAPGILRERLRLVDGAWKLSHLGVSRERFLAALLHGGAMRGRLTSLDLAYLVGVLPKEAEAIVDTWAA